MIPVEEHQADWDAETLATAEVIKKDPGRLEAAKVAAEKKAKEQAEAANAMRKVARNGRTSRKKQTGHASAVGDLI